MTPLHRLAEQAGILPEYVDQTGREIRRTSDETRIAILRAMGIDASTPESAREALAALKARERARIVEPVRVRRRASADLRRLELRVPGRSKGEVAWEVEIVAESGMRRTVSGVSPPGRGRRLRIPLAEALPEGYHTLRARLQVDGEERSAQQSLIVVPRACPTVRRITGRSRVFGIFANLYTVRSADDWGIGDLSTLGRLLEWTAQIGGSFVGVNPLHALRNSGWDVSPYSPVSRIYRNPIYLDVTAVPGIALDAGAGEEEWQALRASERVEYERVMALKRRVLQPQHPAAAARAGDDYRRYIEAEGEPLTRFATFEALVDHLGRADWREWPEAYRDPESPAVLGFTSEHEREVDFHRWLQFELDRQLAAAGARGKRAALGVGLYQDLAIGTARSAADVWANPTLFLSGVGLGAPPDDYSASGQNWGLPPIHPRVLYEDGYRYWISLLRASLRHSGALRIDHALGLFRQFWIPDGMGGADGAYVRFPVDDLLGIVALEATRHSALVVGEDLGTIPPEVPPTLKRWGLLSSRVFFFEREGEAFRAAAAYEPKSLTTATTHDMAPLAGFWTGRDIAVRRQTGVIGSDEAAEWEYRTRDRTRLALLARLAEDGALPDAGEPASGAALRAAVHRFLLYTPAVMVGLNLDDLVGEVESVNIPGVTPDRYASWTRKLATPVERLADDPEVRAALVGVASPR